MEQNKINTLIQLWLDGNTNASQERELQEYFKSNSEIPTELQPYKIIFCGFNSIKNDTLKNDSVKDFVRDSAVNKNITRKNKNIFIKVLSIAACISLLIGLFFTLKYYTEPYCYIDGKPIRDKSLAMQTTKELSDLNRLDETFAETTEILKDLENIINNNQ